MNSYKNNNKFLRIANSYAHEYSWEKSKYADNALFNFLQQFFSSNGSKNTKDFFCWRLWFVIHKLLSSKDFEIESYLLILIILVPDNKNFYL